MKKTMKNRFEDEVEPLIELDDEISIDDLDEDELYILETEGVFDSQYIESHDGSEEYIDDNAPSGFADDDDEN